MFRSIIGLAMVWSVMVASEGAEAAKRVALVIGNSAYQHTQVLPNPKNDARAIAAKLREIGFESVTLKLDLGYDPLRRALRSFEDLAVSADTAVVFFAGHGMELGGTNYLVPTDAKLRIDRHLEYEAVKLSSLMRAVNGAKRLRLVILDACRNNPFAAGMRLSSGARRSVTRGFGRIEPRGDALVAYAARHGTTAKDGDTDHSPYTAALLKHMSEPGLDIRLMFGKVRDSVRDATAGEQEPHIYGTLGGNRVFLVPPKITQTKSPDEQIAALRRELEALKSRKSKPNSQTERRNDAGKSFEEMFEEYFGQKLSSKKRDEEEPLDRTVWSTIRDTNSREKLDAFIRQFPKSPLVDLARKRLKRLREDRVAVGTFPDKAPTRTERNLKPGDEFSDCDDCPKMVVVPSGSFTMGSPKNERGRNSNEGPQRQVTISQAFAVGKYEVTVDQYKDFVRDAGYDAGSKCDILEMSKNKWRNQLGNNFRDPGFSQTGSHPATCLNWADAKAYVAWLSRKTGKTYRLLSEAEWEYVTRAGSTTRFHFGDHDKDLCVYGNGADRSTSFDWKNKSCGDGVGARTVQVGSYKSNAFGLHDMHGNVWEWVEDCWNDSHAAGPSNGSPRTSGDCNRRALRGGSWGSSPRILRSAFRNWSSSTVRRYHIGLRVARTLTF